MAGAVEQLIIFGPAFARPRFATAGAQRDLIVGQAGEEGAPCVAAMAARGQRAIRPGLQGVEGALETESLDGHVMGSIRRDR